MIGTRGRPVAMLTLVFGSALRVSASESCPQGPRRKTRETWTSPETDPATTGIRQISTPFQYVNTSGALRSSTDDCIAGNAHIIPNPSLYQSCEKCRRGQTEYEAHEPIGIDSDIGGRWNKRGMRLRRSERDGDPARDEGRKLS